MKKMVALIVMDGYGKAEPGKGNAVSLANKPNLDRLFATYPNTDVEASGLAVGLPEGQMGNSEVGHMNLGAGRVVYQSLTRINVALKDGSFFQNEAYLNAIKHVKKHQSKLHIFGLLSDGGVHSHTDHIKALLTIADQQGLSEKTYVHAFLDGRDTPPQSAKTYLDDVIDHGANVATVSGRYYAMDRDKNFERIQLAYDAITQAKGPRFACPFCGVSEAYEANVTDEFVIPFVTNPKGIVESNDAVIFANFRPDRAIEIGTAISNPEASPAMTDQGPKNVHFVSTMHYAESVKGSVAFALPTLENMYGDVIAQQGMTQLRIAETEKYAHVTFFFDGGTDKEIQGSSRILVDSPKVATYDMQPEMSALEVTEKAIEAIDSNQFDTMILNFANCDMVGHTGVIEAAVKAVETTDQCVGRVIEAIERNHGIAILTADHGNAEQMLDDTNTPFTAHTINKVPLLITDKTIVLREGGILADIAPTMLDLLGVKQPEAMTGKTLIDKK